MKTAALLTAATIAFAIPAMHLAGTSKAHAEVEYPWCLVLGFPDGTYSCGYVSWAQCMASRAGNDMCVANPRYRAVPAPRERSRR
jgi:hypothetical protein